MNPESNPILVLDFSTQLRRHTNVAMFVCGAAIVCCGCATTKPEVETAANVRFAVETYAKAARLIQYSDWIGYEEKLEDVLADPELTVLQQYRPQLEELIEFGLWLGPSIYGAKLAARFRFESAYAPLREKILQPKDPYLWEGSEEPDYDEDHQFQYQTAYIEAMVELKQTSLSDALRLTPAEHDLIVGLMNSPDDQKYWARWMLKKLGEAPE